MKIRSYELCQIPPRWLSLKIESDKGISGWGEPVMEVNEAHVKQIAEAGYNRKNPVWKHQDDSIAEW